MAQLIQLRARIKAVETIKKITHAMRLIAMSSHSRLRVKEEPFATYLNALSALASMVRYNAPDWKHTHLMPVHTATNQHLVILVGSQRGLCGNFNSALFHFFEATVNTEHTMIIGVGKKAVGYLISHGRFPIAAIYPDLSMAAIPAIAQQLMQHILAAPQPFTTVSVVSNQLKTFFIQKPQITQLIPFAYKNNPSIELSLQDYLWEEEPKEVLEYVIVQMLEAHIQHLLFQSLLAEQAARFISMDSATRNAQGILDTIKLSYNKLRQAKITKELTELSSTL
jgi:F-type H+-transporting ATPase subunit gamma